jgi:hypothetical protein
MSVQPLTWRQWNSGTGLRWWVVVYEWFRWVRHQIVLRGKR